MRRFSLVIIATSLVAAIVSGVRADETRLPLVIAPVVETATVTVTTTAINTPTLTATSAATTTPTGTNTRTSTPTSTSTPTATNDEIATATSTPTFTPTLTPTPTATEPSNAEPCHCNFDDYNCTDFATQPEAQACHDHCEDLGAGDIHRLDGNDDDGLACESLPPNIFTIWQR